MPATRRPSSSAIDDLRILQLAELYERAYEGFIRDAALILSNDDRTTTSLLRLAEPARRQRERLAQEIEDILARAESEEEEGVMRGALLDVVELERASRQFYLEHADRVHDPRLAALFRQTAHDKMRDIRLAEDTLAYLTRSPFT